MIQAILECFNSKRDRNGNCYWAFRWTDTQTGESVAGQVSGGESNVGSIMYGMGLTCETCHHTRTEMGIRDFNRMVKTWPYAGCTKEELAHFVRKGLQ
jgi:hypothetical protein